MTKLQEKIFYSAGISSNKSQSTRYFIAQLVIHWHKKVTTHEKCFYYFPQKKNAWYQITKELKSDAKITRSITASEKLLKEPREQKRK